MAMNATEMRALLEELGARLHRKGIRGEMLVLEGTAMALAFDDTRRTKDIDAVFEPKTEIYAVAREMAVDLNLPEDWLNDAAKGFLASEPTTKPVLDVPGLTVRAPSPDYLLAMKVLAGRGTDLDDVRLLLRELNIQSLEEALNIVEKYYPRDRIPAKSKFFLEEILGPGDAV